MNKDSTSKSAPWLRVPTSNLSINKRQIEDDHVDNVIDIDFNYNNDHIVNNRSYLTSSSPYKQCVIEESTGKNILDYLWDKYKFSNDEQFRPIINYDKYKKQNITTNMDDSFFTTSLIQYNSIEDDSEYEEEEDDNNEVGLIEKSKIMLSLMSSNEKNIQSINKDFLLKHNLNIGTLITKCKTPICDLKKAGIVTSLDDLIELGFIFQDITLNRKLFNPGHMSQLFNTTFKKMEDKMNLDMEDIIQAKLLPCEWETLCISLPDLIESTKIKSRRNILRLGYDIKSLISLGLTGKHLQILDITKENVKQYIPTCTPEYFNTLMCDYNEDEKRIDNKKKVRSKDRIITKK